MAREQDETPRSYRLLAVGAVSLLACAGALAFGRVFRGHTATLKLLAAGLLSVGIAAALERRGPLLALLGSAAGLLVAVGLLVFPKTVFAIFPTLDTFKAMGHALDRVGEQARVQVAPTVPLRPLLLAAVTAVWTASFAAHALAIRSGSPLLAALPPASLLAFADILLDDGPRPAYAALFLMAAFAVLFIDGLRRVRQWGPLRPWPGARRHRLASTTATRGARRVSAVAVGAALIIPGILPGYTDAPLLRIDTSTILSGPAVNPLVSVTASLKQDKPQELFLVQAEQPAYWRWLALDQFDGTTWTNTDLDVDEGQVIPSGDILPRTAIEVTDPDVHTIDLHQTVFMERSPGKWLPMAFHPLTVAVGRSSVRFDPDVTAAVATTDLSPGIAYTVWSRLVVPTRQQLDRVTDFSDPALRRYEYLPGRTPQEIYRIAQRLTGDQTTPFRKVLAIQNYLHTFTYDRTVSGAHDVRTLVNFLDHTHRGFCQQFASAMAVLVRAIGIPARVAVGFTPGRFDPQAGAWRVSTNDAHSWVEILFPGYGWLAFEPTPTRNNPIADLYLSANPVPAPLCVFEGTCPGSTGGSTTPRTVINRLLAQDTFNPATAPQQPGTPQPLETGKAGRAWWKPLLLLALALALLFFLIVAPTAKIVARRSRVLRAHSPNEIVLASYRSFSDRAGDLGLGRNPGETLREYLSRLRSEARFSGGHPEVLTSLAGQAAYSVQAVGRGDADAARRAARDSLKDLRRGTPWVRRVIGVFRLGW